MLTPDYLETLPDALVELWQQVEDDILRDIARRIGKMPDRDTLTDTAAWQAWRYEQMQACHQDVLSLLSKYSGKSKAEIRRLLLDAVTMRCIRRWALPPLRLIPTKPSTTC